MRKPLVVEFFIDFVKIPTESTSSTVPLWTIEIISTMCSGSKENMDQS